MPFSYSKEFPFHKMRLALHKILILNSVTLCFNPNAIAMKLLEVELLTKNITETQHFYQEIMGFTAVEKKEQRVSFQVGSSFLHFRKTDELKNPVYHFAFDIPENRLMEALEWIKERAQVIPFQADEIIDFSNWHAKSFYFYDNNGNILECIVRFDLHHIANKRFDADSFLKISEIGFVTEDVLKFCEEINNQYDTEFFAMQPKGETFSVLGDNDGLFIISGENRNWFPTSNKAEPFLIRVLFENRSKQHELVFDPKSGGRS